MSADRGVVVRRAGEVADALVTELDQVTRRQPGAGDVVGPALGNQLAQAPVPGRRRST
ncbi:hypothetical protein ACOBQX_08000 [Actinokineospora sp. G85]|uniref:hypothetical protein n=1 Tax=Actinokineospora sp. G85 TaxID=3406626 RepID=UPI003C784B78